MLANKMLPMRTVLKDAPNDKNLKQVFVSGCSESVILHASMVSVWDRDGSPGRRCAGTQNVVAIKGSFFTSTCLRVQVGDSIMQPIFKFKFE